MKNIVDPQQSWLFDQDLACYSDLARRELVEGWPGVFRRCLLELMPAEEVGEHFSEELGRPTKELYSVCGLLLLMEFHDWTVEQASSAYMFDGRILYALNLGRDNQSMSSRTVERYQQILRHDKLAHEIMNRVTNRLVELLDIEVDQLRLDSTHVFSNMASFGRTRLMLTASRRFLIQVKRHEPEKYSALPEALRERYEKNGWSFSKGSRKGGPTREEAATDMHTLIAAFEHDEEIVKRSSFQAMLRIFTEQCEIIEDKVRIREKTGIRTMQNPSDPGATYDPVKGPGYQVQTAETCSDKNKTQLIVSAIPQTACEHDQEAVEPIVSDLQSNGFTPTDIVADTAYGGDKNYCHCAEQDIKLTAPVLQGTQKEGRIPLHEFGIDKQGRITCCPADHTPLRSWFSNEEGRGGALFDVKHCEGCRYLDVCQVRKTDKKSKNYSMYYDSRNLRIVERKLDMHDPWTAELYAKRSGIEAAYSLGKRVLGLGRLRVRGESSVFTSILLKIAAINILRASKCQDLVEMATAS